MATYDYFWKAYLYNNILQLQAKNYVARVVVNPTLYPADLARLIWQEGSEVREETILSIITRSESIIRRKALEGHCVMMPNYHMMPTVRGVWENLNTPFDPDRHYRTVSIYTTQDMRRALQRIGIELLGLRDFSRVGITCVTNAATGETNGHITPGDDVVLEGERLKVTVDDPDAGVFFISPFNGAEYRVTHRLTQNFPTCVIARVPADLPPEEYRVVIRTRYTSGGKYTQKELQDIKYDLPLQVLEDD